MALVQQDGVGTSTSTPLTDTNDSMSTSFMVGISYYFAQKYSGWIIDSGASDHMCHDLTLFESYVSFSDKDNYITIPDGKRVFV